MVTRVGWIGIGDQGGRMAMRVVDAGFPLTVWARRPEAFEPFASTAAAFAPTLAELARSSDVVCVVVVNDDDVREVLGATDGVLATLAAGSVVLVHSTVHPDTCRELATMAATRGIALLDAPVSGGGAVAAAGELTVMVGGPLDAFERVRPVLATFGGLVAHLGEVGSGQLAKLVNNVLMAANLALADDAFGCCDQLGLDPVALAAVLSRSSGGSASADVRGRMGSLDPLRNTGAPLLRKDADLFAAITREQPERAALLLAVADAALTRMGHPSGPDASRSTSTAT